jgi:DNA polymerase-3 subunit gamma/tau
MRPEGSLHLKYRPQTLEEVFGNDEIVMSLQSIIKKPPKERDHVFLFTGQHGSGKSTFARILRNLLECHDVDFKERNAANTRGIDTIREDVSQCSYAPMGEGGKTRVYFYDEAHSLTGPAAEALLKVTEGGVPSHVYFIFATTNPEKMTNTLKSRCAKYQVKTLNRQEMNSLLRWVLKEEGKEVWPTVMREIIKYANGIPREALVLLSQVINLSNEEDAIEVIQKYTEESNVIDLCRALDGPGDWKIVAKMLNGLDEDVEKVRLAILGYFSKALLSTGKERHAQIMYEFSQPFDRNGKPGLILSCYAAKIAK